MPKDVAQKILDMSRQLSDEVVILYQGNWLLYHCGECKCIKNKCWIYRDTLTDWIEILCHECHKRNMEISVYFSI